MVWIASTPRCRASCESFATRRRSCTSRQTALKISSKIRAGHAAFAVPGPRAQDIALITDKFCAIMNVLDPIRNRGTFAHPTKGLLVINAARTIFHYLDAKLK